MKSTVLISIVVIFAIISSCQTSTSEQSLKDGDSKANETIVNQDTKPNEIIKDEFLVIQGKDIWIRDLPVKGKVIMKLNEGDKCKITEKGELGVIRGIPDYWYKINFNDKVGWVFGSQTDIKEFKPINEAFTGELLALCDDPFVQIAQTPPSFSFIFKQDNSFSFNVAAGYSIEGNYSFKNSELKLNVKILLTDSPDGKIQSEISGSITFSVYIKDKIICLCEKSNHLSDKNYSVSGGCYCLNK